MRQAALKRLQVLSDVQTKLQSWKDTEESLEGEVVPEAPGMGETDQEE